MVLYNPDWQLLGRALEALADQVDRLCLVDNSDEDNSSKIPPIEHLDYIPLNGNRGIAEAQNIGIQHLLERRFRYILFADQDSIATANMVGELKRRHRILSRTFDVAAVGPTPINRHTERPYVSQKDERILRRMEIEGYEFWEAHSIISSFSLISAEALRRTGLMDDSLFIDFVDQEWCWRARRKGQRVFIATDLHFSHEQGRHSSTLGIELKISTPMRLYFQIRNLLWLVRRGDAPRGWQRRNLAKACYKMVGYPLLITPRTAYIKSIFRALRDGLFSKSTKYE